MLLAVHHLECDPEGRVLLARLVDEFLEAVFLDPQSVAFSLEGPFSESVLPLEALEMEGQMDQTVYLGEYPQECTVC